MDYPVFTLRRAQGERRLRQHDVDARHRSAGLSTGNSRGRRTGIPIPSLRSGTSVRAHRANVPPPSPVNIQSAQVVDIRSAATFPVTTGQYKSQRVGRIFFSLYNLPSLSRVVAKLSSTSSSHKRLPALVPRAVRPALRPPHRALLLRSQQREHGASRTAHDRSGRG